MDSRKRYWDLILYRANAQLKSEVDRAYLGMIWWVLEPVLYLGIFYIVFEWGLRSGGDDFVPFLLCGLVAWKWLDSTVRTSSAVIINNASIMNSVYLPKIVFPLIVILSNSYKFFIILFLLLLFLILYGIPVTIVWLALPLIVLIEFILVCALSILSAVLVPFVADIKHVINYGMTFLFFSSGIFFDISRMRPDVQEVMNFNPVLVLIDCYRSILLENKLPELTDLFFLATISIVLLVVALMVFRKLDHALPRVVN